MAQLFWKWTLKEHIQNLNWFDQSKIDIIQDLYNDYKNWLLNDEVKYKEKFNKVFFGDLLWYQDRIHRIPEWTISWTGNADLIFWNFEDGREDAEKIQIVCELKWAKSNLTKKQFWHGWLSPVWQWFAYKTWLKNCKWLMVSNFYEIKLYRDNQTDSEEWNLQMLLDPKDDYFNLKSLFLLLQKDNLLAKEWLSNTEKLLSHFRDEQQKITKNFYKEYKELRIDLIKDMNQHNPWISSEILIEKAQKIIDRLIFIFFCEDKGLLPDKKLKEWIFNAWQRWFSPREMTKRFFVGVNSGSEKLEIPDWYNGWLFKEDSILNNLVVWDEICRKFIDLTNYDFDDELSVNVLGHIFEQSISDLEELKEDLIGRETKDNGKWKRKKDGIFYTPEYIVDYIVQNSVMKYLNEKEDECLNKHKNKKNWELLAYQEYQQILQNIKVLDPACGSGAFLVRVFDVLFEENKRVGSILNSLFDDTEAYKNILTNNIYGVDLNAESVEITKLSLWLKSAQKGKKLNNLDANIKCGNSLIDDKTITDKAFDWNTEFKEIMGRWGFDVVVWNPPYVDSESMTKHYPKEREYISNNYEVAKGNWDLFIPFIEKSNELLNKNGNVSMIVPNKWLSMNYWTALRLYIKDSLYLLSDFSKVQVFQNVWVFPIIFAYNKKNNATLEIEIYNEDSSIKYKKELNKDNFKNLDNFWIYFSDEPILLNKMLNLKLNIGDVASVFWAFTTGEAYELIEFIKDNPQEKWKKLINTGTLDRYFNHWGRQEIVYLKSKYQNPIVNDSDLELKFTSRFKKINTPKIIISWIRYFRCFYDKNNEFLAWKSTSVLTNLNNNYLYETILSIFNSKLISFFLKQVYSSSWMDWGINFSPDMIKSIPIPEITFSEQQPFIERADKMLSLNKELHELTDKFFNRIKDNLKVEKITKKLESFYEWEFKDFLDELKKQKIILSLSDQDQREPYFKEYKEKILVLKGEIERTDREIDEMVFELYGLSEEEKRVVEGK